MKVKNRILQLNQWKFLKVNRSVLRNAQITDKVLHSNRIVPASIQFKFFGAVIDNWFSSKKINCKRRQMAKLHNWTTEICGFFGITADWFNVDFTSNKTENTWMSLHNLLSIVLLLPICGKFLIRNSTVQFWLMCCNKMSFKIKSRYNGLKFHIIINHPAAYFMIIMHLISNSKQHRHMSAVYTSCKWLNFNFFRNFLANIEFISIFIARRLLIKDWQSRELVEQCWSRCYHSDSKVFPVASRLKRQYRLISCAKAV